MSSLVNFVVFQVGWFACVLGAARGLPWVGTAIAAIIVAWHVARAPHPRPELALVLGTALLGFAWDSALVAMGWIAYPNGAIVDGTAPVWIVAMWALFATTLNVSLRWLKHRLPLAVALGAAGGPLAYAGGGRLGGLAFVAPVPALVALALGWAVLTPLLLRLADRWDGFRPGARRAPPPDAGAG
jgi:hypothetical protein